MDKDVLAVLLQCAAQLDTIDIPIELLSSSQVFDPKNRMAINDHCLRKRWSTYCGTCVDGSPIEKDPNMKKIFGSWLRVDTALSQVDPAWRQRSGWGRMFWAVYRMDMRAYDEKWNDPREFTPLDITEPAQPRQVA